MNPRVSIIMAVYNAARTLGETIESLQRQTFGDWELICVDDGSTDDSLQVLQRLTVADSRIQHVRLEKNAGLTRALIKACDLARGEYLARQDAGDLSLPRRLERQVRFLDENPEVVAVGSGIARIAPGGEMLQNEQRNLTAREVTDAFLEAGRSIVHAGAMFRRSTYMKAGGYRAEFRVAQDIDLWYRMSECGLLAEIPEVLFVVRIEPAGISALNNDRQRALAGLAQESYRARKQGMPDAAILERAAAVSRPGVQERSSSERQNRRRVGEGHYFLGSELYRARHPTCRQYLWKSVFCGTHVVRSLLKLFLSLFYCRRGIERNT